MVFTKKMIIFEYNTIQYMINNNSNTLRTIREVAEKIIPYTQILLFGSRARNKNSCDSDYDLLIITQETIDIRKKRTLAALLRKELAKFKIPADIIIQSNDELDSKKEITGHILKYAYKEGVPL